MFDQFNNQSYRQLQNLIAEKMLLSEVKKVKAHYTKQPDKDTKVRNINIDTPFEGSDRSKLVADEETSKKLQTSNILSVVKHFNDMGISLNKTHLDGIDFTQGSLQDHIDQIQKKLQ